MPELPEVETIRRELQAVLPGSRLTKLEVALPKMVKIGLPTFRRRVLKASMLVVERRAKLLMIGLSSGWTLLIHLKMTGQLIWRPTRGRLRVGGHPIPGGLDHLPNKYSHVVFTTNRGVLFFNDQRQFGYVKMVPTKTLVPWLEKQGYGPEPLLDDFTFAVFTAILDQHAKKKVKPTLLDQAVIAGVGNIYADESLWYAKVRPDRRIASLTESERKLIYRGLRHTMELSLRHNGTTANSYRRPSGQKGDMVKFLNVYGRHGLPCKRCHTRIARMVLAGRGTHYCPRCQR